MNRWKCKICGKVFDNPTFPGQVPEHTCLTDSRSWDIVSDKPSAAPEDVGEDEAFEKLIKVIAIKCFNIGCLKGHEDTVEACFTVPMPQDLGIYNSDIVLEMLNDGSIPEYAQLKSGIAHAQQEKIR